MDRVLRSCSWNIFFVCPSILIPSRSLLLLRQVPGNHHANQLANHWQLFIQQVDKFERQVRSVGSSSFAFWFAEGSLVKALTEGHWLLLDEINLASNETLERLTGVLEGSEGTLTLTERGDTRSIQRHPNFRLFACMNPATDFGKKELSPAIRGRFTELYVDETQDPDDLEAIVRSYLRDVLPGTGFDCRRVVGMYVYARQQQALGTFLDGDEKKPHFSLRSLCRALVYCSLNTPLYGFHRALFDGCCMSFCTSLTPSSRRTMRTVIARCLFGQDGNPMGQFKQIMSRPVHPPSEEGWVFVEGYWLPTPSVRQVPPPVTRSDDGQLIGGDGNQTADDAYIITPTIRHRLGLLARAVSGKYPILLQGPTSAGKTSMVTYLAQLVGRKCVRINNHQHTDIQEYIGSYVSGPDGRLVFQEGALVRAVREGHWIILDELNLAPSEVLEALNRLLDDNREIFIPETQETVKAHPAFQLFATQNPPGLYGGRKVCLFFSLSCSDHAFFFVLLSCLVLITGS